jgi:hypothetical protein
MAFRRVCWKGFGGRSRVWSPVFFSRTGSLAGDCQPIRHAADLAVAGPLFAGSAGEDAEAETDGDEEDDQFGFHDGFSVFRWRGCGSRWTGRLLFGRTTGKQRMKA